MRSVNLAPNIAEREGDIVFDGERCNGRDIHPYEVMFMKTNRGTRLSAVVTSLSSAFDR